jgi:hypothetical protein
MERRDFMQVCAASAFGLGTPQLLAAADAQPRHYAQIWLIGESGQVLRASHLAAGEKPARALQRVTETTAATALTRFCRQQVHCQ